MSYYVYAHTRPDQTIFYVGKGTKGRAWSAHGRNQRWQRTVAKHGLNVVLLADGLTQEQAVEEEATLIQHFKKFGCLVNILDRGDISPTSNPEVAAKVSASASKWQLGRKLSESHRRSISKSHPWKGVERPSHAALMRSKGLIVGDKNPMYGKGHLQAGEANPSAQAVVGVHADFGQRHWGTLKFAAQELGVTVQAISQALKKSGKSKGWAFRRAE